jgi:hypothetical protein
MAFMNGSGEGGGNSSVWFEVRHGSDARPQTLEAAGVASLAPQPSDKRRPTPRGVAVVDRPRQGQVKVDNDGKCACVSIHDSTNLDELGIEDHKGMFRVRLRIRKETMEQLIASETDPTRRSELQDYWAALPGIAERLQKLTGPVPGADRESWENTDGDVFLIVDVPAVKRKPADAEPWPYMPWEIYWQW